MSNDFDFEEERQEKPPAFSLELTIKMKMDFAVCLANFILDSPKVENKAILALAHQIMGNT